jgi:hypothetical protein
VVIGLVAWLLASFTGGPPVQPLPFLALGAAGVSLSTLHLGRKERAWRAALNWRRSWLSREVIAVPLFLALAAAHLQVAPAFPAGALAGAAGLAALACVDRVYVALARERRSRWDDAAALLGALFLAGVLAAQAWIVCLAGLARLAAFADRLRRRRDAPGPGAWTLTVARVGLGLALPMTVVLTAGPYGLPLAVAAGLVGELLDRASFYDSLEVTTPRGRMASDLAERGVRS